VPFFYIDKEKNIRTRRDVLPAERGASARTVVQKMNSEIISRPRGRVCGELGFF